MIGLTLAEIRPGDSAEIVRRVEASDLAQFIDAVGDHNPVHSDPAFAATTPFGEPIAPGVFTAGLISAVIGTRLPGPGAIYLSQSLTFLKPVRAGDTITARVEVLEVVPERRRIRLATACTNQRGEPVLAGEAWVRPSPAPVRYDARGHAAAVLARLALAPWAWGAQALRLWGTLAAAAVAAPTSRGPR